MNKLPVTIISPVMNCANAMPAHAAHLRMLAGMVREIIIVDSQSSDGTKEYLQQALGDLEIRFLDHPPGLYPSWNYAISQATQPFLTMATVGDILSAEALERLHETINKFSADVVISAPTFVNTDGSPSKKQWAVHQLLSRVGRTEQFEMDAALWITANYGFYSASLIGSSAGNLYRTSLMQEHPFPTEFGHWGDCAWALKTGHLAKWVIAPNVTSTFLLHPFSKERTTHAADAFERKQDSFGRDCFEQHRQMLVDAGVPDDVMEALEQAIVQIQLKHQIRSLYNSRPTLSIPWFLNFYAVKLRRQRNQVEKLMNKRRNLVLSYVSSRLDRTQLSL